MYHLQPQIYLEMFSHRHKTSTNLHKSVDFTGLVYPGKYRVGSLCTFVMGSSEGVPVLVESRHDDLPLRVHVVKVSRLAGQLFPDVLTQEDVLWG